MHIFKAYEFYGGFVGDNLYFYLVIFKLCHSGMKLVQQISISQLFTRSLSKKKKTIYLEIQFGMLINSETI